jgi:hypothetical protein
MYKPTTIALLVFSDGLSAALSAYAAASLADELKLSTPLSVSLWVRALEFVLIVLLCLLVFDCYRQLLRRPLFDVVLRVLGGVAFAAAVALFLNVLFWRLELFRWQGPGPIAAILTACAVLAVRLVFRAAAGEHEEPAPQGKAWRKS